jgi:hypothetical protein
MRFNFETKLVCIAREKLGKDIATSVKLQRTLGGTEQEKRAFVEKSEILIKCKGDYPLLRFTDVRNDHVSIASLWERFQMTKMNKELLTPLN